MRENLNIIETTNYLSFELSSEKTKIINTSDTLMFEIRSYHEDADITQTLLDFIDVFGGIY